MNLLVAVARSSIRRTPRLDEAALRELWRFRLGMIDLKDGVTEEVDFEKFCADFSKGDHVWTVRNRSGALVLTMMLTAERVRLAGREVLMLVPEYGFVAPEARSGPLVPLAMLTLVLLALAEHRSTGAWFTSGTYPSSYISWAKGIAPMWTVQSADLSAADRELLLAMGRHIAGDAFRESDGTIDLRTRPRPTPEPRSAEGRRHFAHYETCNPDWREGRALLFTHPFDLRDVPSALWRAATRRRTAHRPATRPTFRAP